MSVRVARLALVVLIVGLALHYLAMALLWDAGVRDTALDVGSHQFEEERELSPARAERDRIGEPHGRKPSVPSQ